MVKRLLLVAAAALLAGHARAQSLAEADTAYRANRVAEAERMLAAIAANPSATAADRASALRQSSRIAWLIDGDLSRASDALRAAARLDEDGCATATETARLLSDAGRANELLPQADALAARCAQPAEADGLLLHLAAAALDGAVIDGGDPALLARARALMDAASEEARASLAGTAIRLQIALLQREAQAALQAWRDYFWLADTDLPQGIASPAGPPRELLTRALAAGAGVEDRLALVDLLVRAGFARAAERFAASTDLASEAGERPAWRRVSAYFEARRALVAALLTANRAIARGRPAGDVQALYRRFGERLIQAAGGGDSQAVLKRAYGLSGQAGLTGGFPSVHLGHIMQDEQRTIEQYGHRAEVGFIALDNMIANGFQSWLWDGSAAAGGWTADGPVIVQVRSGYVSSPLRYWRIASGGRARDELLARQAQRAAADVAALAGGRAVALPGLADRLELQFVEQLRTRAATIAEANGNLRRAFLDEAWRAAFQQSILSHEGRHAIDRRLVTGLARLDDANLEYRAKLSELALADYPRLALYNIVAAGVGDGTDHGTASARIVHELAAWAAANRQHVAGFDPALPPATQLDRLTDEQLRAVARSLDPIAR